MATPLETICSYGFRPINKQASNGISFRKKPSTNAKKERVCKGKAVKRSSKTTSKSQITKATTVSLSGPFRTCPVCKLQVKRKVIRRHLAEDHPSVTFKEAYDNWRNEGKSTAIQSP